MKQFCNLSVIIFIFQAGFTPLHLASQEGHVDMTNLLLKNGADPNAKAKNGLAPIHLCAQEDRVNVAGESHVVVVVVDAVVAVDALIITTTEVAYFLVASTVVVDNAAVDVVAVDIIVIATAIDTFYDIDKAYTDL